MTMSARKSLAFLLVLLFAGSMYAETPEQVKALDREWAEATMHADVKALNRLLSKDLTYTHTDGQMQTKREFIDSVRKGEIHYDSIEFEASTARVYGNASVTVSRLRIRLTIGDRTVKLHPCFLHVWVKKNGRWQMVAHQATKID